MRLQFRKLLLAAVTPTKARPNDAGFDLTAITKETTHLYREYNTGIAVDIPPGYVGLVFPRSSVSTTGHTLANCVAVIDPGYQGPIKLRFRHDKLNREYEAGERIGQLVVLPLTEVELEEVETFESDTERGAGGFGSTGR